MDNDLQEEQTAMDSTYDLHSPGPREFLHRMNDPAEQRYSYPCIEQWLEYIDLAATDLLHGWLDEGRSQECFSGAFADAFGLLVLEEGQHVLRRLEPPPQRAGQYAWRWEHTGAIVDWVAVPAFTAPRTPWGRWTPEELALALYPRAEGAEGAAMDAALQLHFPTAERALWWARQLLHNSAEAGIHARVLFRAFEAGPEPGAPGDLTTKPAITNGATTSRPPLAAAITGGELP